MALPCRLPFTPFAPGQPEKQGLVVLQEWWGVNEQVKATATDISKECSVRVAIPDLYRSKIAYEVHHRSPFVSLP